MISVLTPTWNRALYLQRVWEGLSQQSFKTFEWIVANDGSSDQTIEMVHALAAKSNFPVTLINASCRIGKSRMDNEAVRVARGEFIIWCDSDDVLHPSALETLLRTWESIPESDRHEYCGVTALCDTKDGVLGNKFYGSEDHIDLSWNELFHKLNSDLLIFTRADLLKANLFLEVDFLISESSVWSVIGTRKTRFLPIILKTNEYRAANCLSHSGHMSYNRGHAYAMALTKANVGKLLSPLARLKRAINYLRYCIHGEIGLCKALKLWSDKPIDNLLLLLVSPISLLLALKDRLQGKVRMTHREFSAANERVAMTTEYLNARPWT